MEEGASNEEKGERPRTPSEDDRGSDACTEVTDEIGGGGCTSETSPVGHLQIVVAPRGGQDTRSHTV